MTDDNSSQSPTPDSSVADTSREESRDEEISVDPEVEADVKSQYSSLILNELMAESTVYLDENGKPNAYFELYNKGEKELDLSELCFTDGKRFDAAKALSGKLAAGEYKCVYTADYSKSTAVSLVHKSNTSLISITLPEELKKDFAYALDTVKSGGEIAKSGEYSITSLATPGYPNTAEGREAYLENEKTGELVIYELMSSNTQYLAQGEEYYDWVELKNVGNAPLQLSDYYLSDRSIDPKRFALPAKTLAPGESFVVYCSADAELTSPTATHAPFKIASDAERIYVTKADGTRSDAVLVTGIPLGGSMGRIDGKHGFFYFEKPTPNVKNTLGVRSVTAEPTPSVKAGVYSENSLTVELAGDGKIYYTLDGTKPTTASTVYTAAFTLSTNAVIRAFSVSEGKAQSPINTMVYILGANHDMPVVNVACDPDDMWSDSKGIYNTRNQWQKWEREINLSVFSEETGDASIDCGIRLSGDGSRELDKKSFQLRFRSRYGSSSFDYDVFGDGKYTSFKQLKLRAGEDYPYTLFRDELITALAGDNTTVNVQDYRYVALYINGEYFGIYCFRDKVDEDYAAYVEGCDADDVTVIAYDGAVEHGSGKEYRELITYVNSHNLSNDEYYQHVKSLVNTESLMDWMINQIYTANRDLANDRCYKVEGGKWEWVLYDTDWGFYHHDKAYYLLTESSLGGTAEIARALLKNPAFKDEFLKRMASQMETVYNYDNICKYIDGFVDLLKSEMPANCEKWGGSMGKWSGYINRLKEFVKVRNQEVIDQTASYFDLSSSEINAYFGN